MKKQTYCNPLDLAYRYQHFIENGKRYAYREGADPTLIFYKDIYYMGYEFYPQALGNVIRAAYKELPIPILITENGIGTENDERRIEFIKEVLAGVESCAAEGIPMLGYLHWSLLDNFEWQKGFSKTFGLIAVDRKTQKRYPKESLQVLGRYTASKDI